MKLLRLWRQYDSVKAAVLLTVFSIFMLGFCIRSAIRYADFLRTPTEYVCTAQTKLDTMLPQLAFTDGIRAYSRQKTARLNDHQQEIGVTMLSAAYLSDCYGLYDSARTIYMNPSAFSAFCGSDAQSPVSFHGTLDGKPYAAQIVCTQNLPNKEPFAAVSVSEAELRDADILRLCSEEGAVFSPESIGLTVQNPEVQTAAAYEEQLVLLRIRFAVLAAFLAQLAAGAFLHIFKLQHKNT